MKQETIEIEEQDDINIHNILYFIKNINKSISELNVSSLNKNVFEERLKIIEDKLDSNIELLNGKIENIENIQNSDSGCTSVKLLSKDVRELTKNINELVQITKSHNIDIENLKIKQESNLKVNTVKAVIFFSITYAVAFGSYVIKSINDLSKTNNEALILIHKEVKDVQKLNSLQKADAENIIRLKAKFENIEHKNLDKNFKN